MQDRCEPSLSQPASEPVSAVLYTPSLVSTSGGGGHPTVQSTCSTSVQYPVTDGVDDFIARWQQEAEERQACLQQAAQERDKYWQQVAEERNEFWQQITQKCFEWYRAASLKHDQQQEPDLVEATQEQFCNGSFTHESLDHCISSPLQGGRLEDPDDNSSDKSCLYNEDVGHTEPQHEQAQESESFPVTEANLTSALMTQSSGHPVRDLENVYGHPLKVYRKPLKLESFTNQQSDVDCLLISSMTFNLVAALQDFLKVAAASGHDPELNGYLLSFPFDPGLFIQNSATKPWTESGSVIIFGANTRESITRMDHTRRNYHCHRKFLPPENPPEQPAQIPHRLHSVNCSSNPQRSV